MTRSFAPSAILAALALAGHVRPRFIDDSPNVIDAYILARGGKLAVRRSRLCPCTGNSRCRV